MDKYKKFFVIILSIGVVLGVGFVIFAALRSADKSIQEDKIITPAPVPQIPAENEEPGEAPEAIFSQFGAVTFRSGDKVTFSDGLSAELSGISDSRCPEGVQCIWEGEISGNLILSGGELASAVQIRLGTVNNKEVAAGNYTFSLLSATPESLAVLVQKN